MRLLLPALLFVLPACSSDPDVGFRLKAVLDAETDGVKLHDGGATGLAAMAEQICVFDVDQGGVLADQDLSSGHETLLDAHDGRALARSVGELHVLDAQGAPVDTLGLDVMDARLAGDTIVAVVPVEGACAAAWLDEDETVAFVAPGTDCSTDIALAVDRRTGSAWIADGKVLAKVDRDGTVTRHEQARADLVAWDASTGGVVVGEIGGQWVQGVTAAGDVSWSRDLTGTLTDVDVAGDAGVVAVMSADGVGGALELVDSLTGEPQARHPLPEPAELSFSSDGRDLGLVLGDRVYLYDVDTDVRLLDTPGVSAAAQLNNWVGPSVAGAGAGTTIIAGLAVALLMD